METGMPWNSWMPWQPGSLADRLGLNQTAPVRTCQPVFQTYWTLNNMSHV